MEKSFDICRSVGQAQNLSRLMAAIGRAHETFTTVMVGDGPELENLKSEVSKINKEVVFAGHFEGQDFVHGTILQMCLFFRVTKRHMGR